VLGRVARTLLAVTGALLGALVLAASASAVVTHRDISYDLGSPPPDPNDNALDVYQPDGTSAGDELPVVVYVHGGAWSAGDKRNKIADKINLFTGLGYVFISVNYRLSPQTEDLAPGRVRFPDHPDDVGEAIGWIGKNIDTYGGDPGRLLLIGHSAGAHLVALASTDPRYVERHGIEPWQLIGTVSLDTESFDVAERIDQLPPQGDLTFYNAFATPEENAVDGAWSKGSPIRYADELDPRFLFVTQGDDPSRIGNNQRMAEALGQDPGDVFAAPYNHEGINDAVGDPGDVAGETAAVVEHFERAVEDAVDPKASLDERPDRRIRTDERRARVRFEFDSSEPRSEFECRLDSKKLRPCDRKEKVKAGDGEHVLRYRALTERGRPGPTKKFSFEVVRQR
jgi:arylformamidase